MRQPSVTSVTPDTAPTDGVLGSLFVTHTPSRRASHVEEASSGKAPTAVAHLTAVVGQPAAGGESSAEAGGVRGTVSFHFDFCAGATEATLSLVGATFGTSYAVVVGDLPASGPGETAAGWQRPRLSAVPEEHLPSDAVLFNTTGEASSLFRSAAMRTDAGEGQSFKFASFPAAHAPGGAWLCVACADDRGVCHVTRATRAVHFMGAPGAAGNIVSRAIGVFPIDAATGKCEAQPVCVGRCNLAAP